LRALKFGVVDDVETEPSVLQSLANTTAVAMENVRVHAELEHRVRDRTLQLELANRELEAFSYSVSHDLRSPLRSIGGFANLLGNELAPGETDSAAKHLDRIQSSVRRASAIIDDLLRLSGIARAPFRNAPVDLSDLARQILRRQQQEQPEHQAEIVIDPELVVTGDAGLLRLALENLLGNAWKYSTARPGIHIHLGARRQPDQTLVFFVRDRGAGFDMAHADKLFVAFQRLHRHEEFSGTGIGLAIVQRIIQRHGGRIWAEAAVDEGATFYFTLPGID
jgi:light-regulated signal transduction histidine kinase (bacteriophytochrome)